MKTIYTLILIALCITTNGATQLYSVGDSSAAFTATLHDRWIGQFYLINDRAAFEFVINATNCMQPAIATGINLFGQNVNLQTEYGSSAKIAIARIDILPTGLTPPPDQGAWVYNASVGIKDSSGNIPYECKGRVIYTTTYPYYTGGILNYKTNDSRWADLPYSNVPGATFRMNGHLLMCISNILNRARTDCGPVTLNNWLKAQPYGYIGLVPNILEALRFGNQNTPKRGTPLRFSYTEIDDGLSRDAGVITSVDNNKKDWVTLIGHTIKPTPTPSTILHRIHDPDGDRNKQFMENITTTPKSTFMIIDRGLYSHIFPPIEPLPIKTATIWGIITDSNTQLTATFDAETEELLASTPKLSTASALKIITDTKMLFPEAKSVKIEINSDEPESIPIYIFEYDEYYNLNANNIINVTGNKTLYLNAKLDKSIFNIPNDSTIILNDGIIAARISTTEMLVQSSERTPIIRIQSIAGQPGQTIKSLIGVLHKDANGICIVASEIVYDEIPNFTISPVAVSIRDLPSTNGILTRIMGRVTDKDFDSIVIDNSVRVFGNTDKSIGELAVIDGAWYNGNFYAQ